MKNEDRFGQIVWTDLTVQDAPEVRDFYCDVIGWNAEEVPMGDYSDFNMTVGGSAIAGVCHKRGVNARLPSQWLIYVTVADLDASLESCLRCGGKILAGPKGAGDQGRYAVIEDPAGAVLAICE